MAERLDPESPVPLFHQLAESIRYRIATGGLRIGDSLPPLRQAAELWGVNLHTVRHAYSTLAAQGLVRTTAPQGTVVIGTENARGDAVAFVRDMVREAETRFNLSAKELSELIASSAESEAPHEAGDVVHVVECSETQAADLALQIESSWRVVARPWSLERESEPPHGPVVATYFHYNDIRQRWPARFSKVHFASIHPDPALAARLRSVSRVTLVERDTEMARNIAADLATALDGVDVEMNTRVLGDPGSALAAAHDDDVVLFAPRVWGALTAAERADERAVEIRYVFRKEGLQSIERALGWEPRTETVR